MTHEIRGDPEKIGTLLRYASCGRQKSDIAAGGTVEVFIDNPTHGS
jgi:hypothetical protein